MRHATMARLALLLACALAPAAFAQTVSDLTKQLAGDDAEARRTAWETLAQQGPDAIVPVGALFASDDPAVRRAAHLAMEAIVARASAPDGARAAAAEALLTLLQADLPATEKRIVLRYVSLVGSDESVAPVAALLTDTDLGEQARETVARIPGAAARVALEERLMSGDPAVAIAAADALAQRGEAEAGLALAWALSRSEGERADAIVRAIGAVDDGTPTDAPDAPSPAELEGRASAQTVLDALLRAARKSEASGRVEDALLIYEGCYESPDAPDQVATGAVLGLGRVGNGAETAQFITDCIQCYGPGFLATCRSTLDKLWPREWERYAKDLAAKPDAPSALVALIARVNPAGASALALERLRAGDSSLPILAVLLGSPTPEAEGPLLEAVGGTTGEARAIALAAYVKVLDLLRAADRFEGLTAKYVHALELAEDDETRNAALLGIAPIADPASRATIEPYAERDSTRAAALSALLGVAAGLEGEGKRDEAIEVARGVLDRARSRETRVAAVQALHDMRVEVDVASAAGFIPDWWLLGPIAQRDDVGWDQCADGVLPVNPSELLTLAGTRFGWHPVRTTDIEGMVDLTALLDPHDNVVAYAWIEVESPADQDVLLKLGSDDGVAVWVNGERVHANPAARPVQADEDTARARLVKGPNSILLKITQGGGGWGYCLRVTDPDGKPLVLPTRHVPPRADA